MIEEPSEAEPDPSNLKDSKDLEKKLALAEMKIAALEKRIVFSEITRNYRVT